MSKNVQTTAQLHSPHMLLKWWSKFSKSGFSNTWTVNFQVFKLVLGKAEEPEIKLPTSTGSSEKQESSGKTSISALLTMPKPLIVWITISCRKFWKRWEYQSTWPASWETYMQVRCDPRDSRHCRGGSRQGRARLCKAWSCCKVIIR